MKVLVLAAMKEEFQPWLHESKATMKTLQPLGQEVWSSESKGHHVDLVFSPRVKVANDQGEIALIASVGTIPAALTAWTSIASLAPDLIVNAGTAGGFASHDTKILDCVLAREVFFHDRRIPLPFYFDYARRGFRTNHSDALLSALDAKPGIVSTGDCFGLIEADMKRLNEIRPHAVEMEAAAIASVCEILKKTLIVFKVITDFADRPQSAEDFLTHLPLAAKSLSNRLQRLLESLA